MKTSLLLLAACLFSCTVCSPVWSQFDEPDAASTKGTSLGEPLVQYLKVGISVTAQGGPCRGLEGTTPTPVAWPEQEMELIDEDISPAVRRVKQGEIGPVGSNEATSRQMLIEIPQLTAGEEAHAILTFKLTRYAQLPPADTSILVRPSSRDRSVRGYLTPSPKIETKDRGIMKIARQIVEENQGKSDWELVEAFYDWVRDNIQYVNGPLKGARQALRDGTGDCEELTSLFIALCRIEGIPARSVWVEGHCYPEFYLVDDEEQGHWFPCQAAGDRAFGSMPDRRPIYQKGDHFRVPESKERYRYVPENLVGKGGSPQVKFIREVLPNLP
ncbi:MAG: transglutaminase-like domain-containing protein [Pirellulales bacterium]